MSERWLEFRVEDDCKHPSDSYGPYCPLCEIEQLQARVDELEKLRRAVEDYEREDTTHARLRMRKALAEQK